LLALPGFAMDCADKTDPDLPQPLDARRAGPLLRSSPFTRKVDLGRALVLTGVVVIDGKLVAIVHEHGSAVCHLVTEEPNDLGWRLVGGKPGHSLERTEVQILVGREQITLRYEGELIQRQPAIASATTNLPQDSAETLARRLQLDLTGRQPTPEEIRAAALKVAR
jgi:hypothetical protein